MQTQKKLFISYQRAHEKDISALVTALEAEQKYDVWYDQKIVVGDWWQEILQAIRDADVVVLALSRTYFDSEACKREREYAQHLNKQILPVTVDPELDYAAIPQDIARYQIKPYFGQTQQFIDLKTALDQLQSPPLPDPLPDAPYPPPAPVKPADPPETNKSLSQPLWGGIAMIAILAVIVLLSLMQGNIGDTPPATDTEAASTPADTPTAPVNRDTTTQGAFDITLQFGGEDSLIVKVNDSSNLNGVTLNTSGGAQDLLTDRFTSLADYEGRIPAGTCLVYERQGTNPVLPLDCDEGRALRRTLSQGEVFWFNDGSNLFENIVVRRGETLIDLCPHANGAGRCNMGAET